ncbi:MAG: hypothetical protein JSW04_14500 [Desulfobacterales bacterium]|nr:MAG: hypothetical protein JSV38_05495 [Desulfobacterales bacterium]UCD89599.1 MAG: hypothetical protein JSW04_14500 [Desulfobacterales bacterium]
MSEIDLQNAKINFEGEWLSSEDLTNKIQEKMQAGDMKFSSYAKSLEELNIALENSHKIETQILLLKDDYDKLKKLGGEDDAVCVKKAIMAFITSDPGTDVSLTSAAEPEVQKPQTIQCERCTASIEISPDEKQTDIECPECGTSIILKPKSKSEVRHKDHFIG